MSIISFRYNENNKWKGKVWCKMCCKEMKLQRSAIKTLKDADN